MADGSRYDTSHCNLSLPETNKSDTLAAYRESSIVENR